MKKDGDICLVAPGSPRCWAVSSSDTAPVLWSLGATVTLSGPAGERRIPIAGALSGRRHRLSQQATRRDPDGDRAAAGRRPALGVPQAPAPRVVRLPRARAWPRRCAWTATSCARRASCWAPSPPMPREAVEAGALLAGQRLTAELIDAAAGVASRPVEAARQHRPHASLSQEDDARLRGAGAAAPGRAAEQTRRRGRRQDRVTALGDRIKALRAERQLQQRQLAEKAGLTPSMVSQIESGRLTPSLHTAGQARRRARRAHRVALRDGAERPAARQPRSATIPVVSFDGTSEQWARARRRALPGQDPLGGLDARPADKGVRTDKVIIRARTDEALLRDRGQGRAPLQWRRSRAGRGRQRLPGRGHAPRLGESRRQAGQGPLGDPG